MASRLNLYDPHPHHTTNPLTSTTHTHTHTHTHTPQNVRPPLPRCFLSGGGAGRLWVLGERVVGFEAAGLFGMAVWLVMVNRVGEEEEIMERAFGEEWREYRTRTNKVCPVCGVTGCCMACLSSCSSPSLLFPSVTLSPSLFTLLSLFPLPRPPPSPPVSPTRPNPSSNQSPPPTTHHHQPANPPTQPATRAHSKLRITARNQSRRAGVGRADGGARGARVAERKGDLHGFRLGWVELGVVIDRTCKY